MKRSTFLRGALAAVFTLALAALAPAWAQGRSDPPGLDNAMAAKAFHVDGLLATPGVVGVGVGLTAGGRAAVVIMTESAGVGGLPRSLDGVPVVIKVTGAFYALDPPPHNHGGGGGDEVDPTSRFDPPVPIGVSTGNGATDEAGDAVSCSAGTIGARLTDGTDFYAMSNNHVYALSNDGNIEDPIVQPGLYDTADCATDIGNDIGALYSYVPLDFTSCSNGGDNYVDVAIAKLDIGDGDEPYVDISTPGGEYTPSSTTVPADVNLLLDPNVQKYGRTTGLTRGWVSAIYADLNVGYSKGLACFRDQIIVESGKGGFIKAGDSGSSLVTADANAYSVGLLFAGTRSGKMAIANPIDWVLDALAGEDITVSSHGDPDHGGSVNLGLEPTTSAVPGIDIDDGS